MLSVPHMIVVFLVVLVVFGPEKLPELARSFGKLMAEFRKASGDFKNAFEEEIRDLERQTRLAELRKQAAEAAAATVAADGPKNPPAAASAESPAGADTLSEKRMDNGLTEAPVINPVAESVPRSDAPVVDSASPAEGTSASSAGSTPSHDQQQPA
jgi:TatA/E family protein of Tat protein translocase